MKFILNLIWFIIHGWALALLWLMTALFFALSIVGLPYAVASCRIASFSACPFGRDLVQDSQMPTFNKGLANILNFFWILLAGIWLFISHIIAGITLCLTLIGIPFGLAHFKLAKICFSPLGKKVISTNAKAYVQNT